MQEIEPTIDSTEAASATPDGHAGPYKVPGTSFGSLKTLAVALAAQLVLTASVLTGTIGAASAESTTVAASAATGSECNGVYKLLRYGGDAPATGSIDVSSRWKLPDGSISFDWVDTATSRGMAVNDDPGTVVASVSPMADSVIARHGILMRQAVGASEGFRDLDGVGYTWTGVLGASNAKIEQSSVNEYWVERVDPGDGLSEDGEVHAWTSNGPASAVEFFGGAGNSGVMFHACYNDSDGDRVPDVGDSHPADPCQWVIDPTHSYVGRVPAGTNCAPSTTTTAPPTTLAQFDF